MNRALTSFIKPILAVAGICVAIIGFALTTGIAQKFVLHVSSAVSGDTNKNDHLAIGAMCSADHKSQESEIYFLSCGGVL